MKDELDAQIAAWLEDRDLKSVVDDKEQWKVKEEQFESMVVESLSNVEVGPES